MLFSGIEGFIFCLFFEKIGGCRKFKWYEWLILSLGNCLISKFLPPVLYQFACIVWITLFIYFTNEKRIFSSVKLVLVSMGFYVTTEMLFSMFYEYVLNIDLFTYDVYSRFVVMILLRIIQIFVVLIIYYIKKRRSTR